MKYSKGTFFYFLHQNNSWNPLTQTIQTSTHKIRFGAKTTKCLLNSPLPTVRTLQFISKATVFFFIFRFTGEPTL